MSGAKQNDFKKYLDPAVVSRLDSLELKSKYIVEGFMLGLHRSPYHGFSIEFSQHRPYMQGDAPKDIDWKVYGKTEKYYVKQYEEETNLKCQIVLDCSSSMSFSFQNRVSKFHYASMLASALAYLNIHQKDAVGLTLYSDKILKSLPPHATQIYLNQILSAISNTELTGKTDTAKCLSQVAEKTSRRGLVVIISDLFDDIKQTISALKHFRFKKNEVIVFQVLDPIETSFAFGSDASFKDLETGELMRTQPHHIQRAYSEAMQDFIANIKKECLNSGIEYNLLQTDTPFDKALFAYLQKRNNLY